MRPVFDGWGFGKTARDDLSGDGHRVDDFSFWTYCDVVGRSIRVTGQIYRPLGDGPFPLVLIVHGNHNMKDYSDPGYGYLGELLPSRGYIFASVA